MQFNQLSQLSEADQRKIIPLLAELEERKVKEEARTRFMPFVHRMWPEFIHGRHHEKMADAFEQVINGKLKRLIINMPPRFSKSEFASYLLPAWYLGLHPEAQVMQLSHTFQLAEGFGRKVRNLVDSDVYHEIFPDTKLRRDSTAAARWNTDKNGIYVALGVGAAVAGLGCNLLILDDLISEQEGKSMNPAVFDNVYSYYMTGPRQRLQPDAAIILIQTRWHQKDLTGRLLEAMIENEGADQWTQITFPAILPSGQPLWPEYWSLEALEKTRATLDNRYWQAQYQQDPTSDIAAIVKREWWQVWDKPEPPKVSYVLMSWDTAYEAKTSADYSAVTVWGIFQPVEDGPSHLILLDAVRRRVEFPELKSWFLKTYEEWEPDQTIIEKRASGASLIQELRRMGIPVQEFTPTRGNDKVTRLNAVADIFASGFVWAPDTRWADIVKDEVASFPAGTNDDLVDCVSLSLRYYRQGGFISTRLDAEDEPPVYRRKVAYY